MNEPPERQLKFKQCLLFGPELVQNASDVNICAAVGKYRHGVAGRRFQERNPAVGVCNGIAVERVRLAGNSDVSAGLPDLRLCVLRRVIGLSDKRVFGGQGFGGFGNYAAENDACK